MSLFLLVAVMAAAVAGGILSERRWHERAERGTRAAMSAMLTWILPPVYFVLVSRLHVDLRLIGGLLTAYAVIAVVGVIAWWVADRVLRLPRPTVGAVILAAILANTGYFGLPLTRVVLGPDELGAAVAWDSLVSGPMFFLVGFAVGAAFAPPGLLGSGVGPPERRLVAFLRNPLLWSAIAGLLVPFDASDALAEVAQWIVYALLPVGFVVVGVQLSRERRSVRAADARPTAEASSVGRARHRVIAPEVALAVGLRLVVAPALVLGVSLLWLDLPSGMLLQAVAPTGLNGLLVAHRFDLTLQPIASSIVWSTTLVTIGVVGASLVG